MMMTALLALVVVFTIPCLQVPYFTTQQFSYEALSYIERGQRMDEDHIVPDFFPIACVVLTNTEGVTPEQLAFSENEARREARMDILTRLILAEGDERRALRAELNLLEVADEDRPRMAILNEEYAKVAAVYGQHFKPGTWEEKSRWERWARGIMAELPASPVWRRIFPAFRYGITEKDTRALLWRVATEMEALKDKSKVRPSLLVEFVFLNEGETYTHEETVALLPGEVRTVECRAWQIDMDEDAWSWEYEVRPDSKWVTKYKRVTPFEYWLHMLESP